MLQIHHIRHGDRAGYEYRIDGQKRRSQALSILPPDTMNELARLLGAPVALRDPSGPNPDVEHSAAIAKAALEPMQAHGVAIGTSA